MLHALPPDPPTQSHDYVVAGEAWAREPTSAACYANMAARMTDPSVARTPEGRARMRELAQEMAGLAVTSFYEANSLDRRRDEDLREKRDLLAHGLMTPAEVTQAESSWAHALQGQRWVLKQILTTYPACEFLKPVNWVVGYAETVEAILAVDGPPVR